MLGRDLQTTGNHQRTVDVVRDAITSAIAEVRSVAQLKHDVQRQHTADWLEKQFVDVSDARVLRSAAADALSLYGGNGSSLTSEQPNRHVLLIS